METKNADLSSLRIDRSNNEENNSSKKTIFIIIGVVLLIIVGYFVVTSFLGNSVEVKLTTAVLQKPGQTTASLTASGYVVAQRKAAIASKGTGRLIYLGVVEGDKVKKNQIIGKLESTDIVAQLDQAKANLNLQQAGLVDAQNTFSRVQDLFNKGLSSQQEFDQAQSNLNRVLASIEVAKAGIRVAEVSLENTLIRAPFDGTVLTKNAEVGEIVAPFGGSTTSKTAVITIADMKSLLVEADVSESNIEKISANQDCEITLDAYPEKSYSAYVFKIVPTADRSKATVLVKVGFKNYDSRVLPEMSAKVSFFTDPVDTSIANQKPILVIPVSAVRNENGKSYVFTITDNKAVKNEIITGQKLGSYFEVLSGLQPGQKVIDSLNEKVKEGVEVKLEE
ncbi:MAG: efflux RND transporter periplasmic adaptor subunit [Ignavibacteriaceae bacterium]|nr:efflux RND transporter periplasmic adaptor subunit [Ignavibacterium sp.]MCC6254492.1 efflux RND transporter periplasmic adaptor subunit [Ignavibacteriaceae bacterium]HMN24855.1 efflux RND transporter periplasmic adaptor subunit [Ignavibacteriaceae bacterium]HRN25529.1 efflux RND transporter periplasmic adaptor subunit [Ignavibacteriaceae bacterium]HRP93590.1 efflux RND transporter periplasmic adaptor subunit [Ignavibacteriaceae bacterium]